MRVALKRFTRFIVRLAALGLCLVAVLLLLLWLWHNQDVTLPAPSGPFAVGRVGYDWIDQARPETLLPGSNAKRELMVWVWYPAVAPPGVAPAPYLPAAWVNASEQDNGLSALLTQQLGHVHAHAVAAAPLAPTQRAYPVLVLEPGFGRVATDYTTLAEDLASHGYVVVGSTPTYSADLVVFPDGRVARSTPQGSIPEDSPAAVQPALERLIDVWAADDQFVLDQVARLNAADPDGRFSGRLDMEAVGVLGHSFGGAAAAQVCHLDRRCKAGVDLDGSPYGDVVQTGLQQPFMFIWSKVTDPADPDSQQSARDTQAIYARLPHGYQITITGARHFNFADMAVLYAPAAKLLGVLGPIDGQRGLAITTAYVRAFFDRYLKQADAPLLDGPAQNYPEVRFEKR